MLKEDKIIREQEETIKSLAKELRETKHKYADLLRKHILIMEKCINIIGYIPNTEEDDNA